LQTKSVNVAAPSRWFPYPGSMGLTSAIIPVNNVAVNVFYRRGLCAGAVMGASAGDFTEALAELAKEVYEK